ncbi:MAG TPA: colanic acid biosynthesis acetyltransferase WcaF [Phycisphaerales bacterium]|nr:colanic acid biosynthesis acetyltransferase WcaF [Phycisphaerales bacterium]
MKQLRSIIWRTVGIAIFSCTPHNAYVFRTALLKLFGMRCGRRVRTRRSVRIDQPWNLSTGDLVIFGDGVVVHASETIRIGNRCVVSQYAMLTTVTGDCETAGRTKRRGSITIEDDCWVATDTVVMPGSHIESGVVVGARSLVDGHLPKWKICIGEPAIPRTERVLYGTN